MSEQQALLTKQKGTMREQQQTHHQQQQPQQQASKCIKEQTVIGCNNANSNTTVTTTTNNTPHKSNIHEMRNQDFISRLMAATPPYLYSAPVGQNFFFSDMLRALVQARQNENVRHLQMQQQHQHQQQQQQQQQQQAAFLARRPRKRLWSQNKPYYEQLRERKDSDEKQTAQSPAVNTNGNSEKPLELTNKTYFQIAHAYQRKVQQDAMKDLSKLPNSQLEKSNENSEPTTIVEKSNNTETIETNMTTSVSGGAADTMLQDTPPAASLPPQDLVLPPPPPVWYPSMYPPYAFDPLHFFIDLRVSGHIYDRKKENVSPLSNSADNNNSNGMNADTNGLENNANSFSLPNKRHGSAFTVPTPRNELKNVDALNLSAAAAAAAASSTLSSKLENYAKYYDLAEAKENNHPFAKHSASYMLQHLPRLYSQFAARGDIGDTDGNSTSNHNDNTSCITDSKSDCDGLESEEHFSIENSLDNISNRDIDVEIIDSIKYRTDAESSHCSSPDDTSITQID